MGQSGKRVWHVPNVVATDKGKGRAGRDDSGSSTESFAPLVDIIESSKDIRITVELPGVTKSSIEAYLVGDMVVVEGVKHSGQPLPEHSKSRRINYLCLERFFGTFKRVVQVPTSVNSQKMKAVYNNGVLTITLPKIEDRRGRKKMIKIE